MQVSYTINRNIRMHKISHYYDINNNSANI